MSWGNKNTAALLQQKWAQNKELELHAAVKKAVLALCVAVEKADRAEKKRLQELNRLYDKKTQIDATVKEYTAISPITRDERNCIFGVRYLENSLVIDRYI